MGLLDRLRRGRGMPQVSARELRDAAYGQLFGSPLAVGRDANDEWCLDFYQYAPGLSGRDYFTVVTGGMSDSPMPVPRSEAGRRRRFELVLYTAAVNDAVTRYLRLVAFLPRTMGKHLDHGFTFRFDDGSMMPGSDKIATLVVDALLDPELGLPSMLSITGEPVDLLLPIPLTGSEWDFVQAYGVQEFFDGPLDRSGYDLMFDPARRSSV